MAYSLILYGWAISSKDEFLRGTGKLLQTGNREVLVVEVWVASKEGVGLRSWLVHTRRANKSESSFTFFTTGSTHGFALSSRYAPMPRSTFFSNLSSR